MTQYDVAVVGGGIVGLTFALSLAQQAPLSIIVMEAAPTLHSSRVSAISLASCRIFQTLGVWDSIKKAGVSPFTGMEVWDATTAGAIQFNSTDIAESVLGYIVENQVVQTALAAKLKQYLSITYKAPLKLAAFQRQEQRVAFVTEEDQVFHAQLAVAADGAKSWLRQQAGIAIDQQDYEQHAIVATVRSTLPHAGIARQVFLATGPLAFLPLVEAHTSSIVWSLPVPEAKRLMELDAEEFKLALAAAFSQRLGAIIQVDKREAFPLYKQQAQHYVKSRLALIGDAAHAIHPLAGQGLNIGLLDAISLAEIITTAAQYHRNIASFTTLRRYERSRRAENLPLLAGIDLIKHLFASQNPILKTLRALGLNTTNDFPWLKNLFTRHAVGER
jgi:2-octaprenylphenol hydroxylase